MAEDRIGREPGPHLGDVDPHTLGRHPVGWPHVRVEQLFRGEPGEPAVVAASDLDPRRGRPVSPGPGAAKQAPRLDGSVPKLAVGGRPVRDGSRRIMRAPLR